MDNLNLKYQHLKDEFEGYQKNAENKIQELSAINTQYEKSLDMLSNIILITNYINSNLSNKKIISMINDMIIGVLGVTYSTIYLLEEFKFIIKATNGDDDSIRLTDKCKEYISNHKTFIINSVEPIVKNKKNNESIHSRMGVPIKIEEKFIGYIIVDHTLYNFLTDFHEIFIKSIASQIAICIENSILYKKIEKAARCDALIGIYNRKTFFQVVNEKIKNNNVKNYAIVMIDIDDFKIINDTLGHQFGDVVLIETVNLIRVMLDSRDVIGRYGGEEIILYLEAKDDYEKLNKRIDNIRTEISKNVISKDGISATVTASFGMAFAPNDGEKLEVVINKADKLMYIGKRTGKNQVISSYMFK